MPLRPPRQSVNRRRKSSCADSQVSLPEAISRPTATSSPPLVISTVR
jgi:hypothetical protein